jgi:hypothetical protein
MLSEEDIRRLAMALPEANEADHHGSPSFVVRKKIFATVGETKGRFTIKLDPEDRVNLMAGHPGVIEPVPGYWGRSGWTLVSLADCGPALAATLLRMAWAGVAPKRLVAEHR